ncbi:MAG: TadE/TadG family type IV pilus assembly protein [Candidatus Limnocylindria bacterium]
MDEWGERARSLRVGRLLRDDDAQSLVEFALLLPVLLLVLMGIIQFGLIFVTYVTMNNASREGARWGSIYVYDVSKSVAANDTTRQDGVVDRIIAARGVLNMSRSCGNNFCATSAWTSGATCPPTPTGYTLDFSATNGGATGDTSVCYWSLSGAALSSARRGSYMSVESNYHLQVFIPLLDKFLPNDPIKGAPWIQLPGRMTVVIN